MGRDWVLAFPALAANSVSLACREKAGVILIGDFFSVNIANTADSWGNPGV